MSRSYGLLTFALVLALASLPPCIARAVEYSFKNFVILVDDQLVLKGPASMITGGGAATGARSDLGSRNLIQLGGLASTKIPDNAPNPPPPTLPDSAIIAPNVKLNKFAAVSMVIYDQATGSYTVSGTGITPPLAGHLYPDLGSNPLNNTGGKLLPDYPPFPAFSAGTTDIAVSTGKSASIVPGAYKDLIIGANATVNFTQSGTYQFRRVIANSASHYSLTMLADNIRINVKEFVHLAQYGSFNPTAMMCAEMYAEGVDGPYGGANRNKSGVARPAGTFPAAFEYGGGGSFNASLVFVKNGTMNIKGIGELTTQWAGNSLQEISNLAATLRQTDESACHPPSAVQCACMSGFDWDSATGVLTVHGMNFKSAAVSGLSACPAGTWPPDFCHIIGSNALAFDSDGTSFSTRIDAEVGLAPGAYYLGILYPINPETGNTLGYCMFTDKVLRIE